ncbi:hypothetical protein FHS78_003631 [Parvibaculum indicum]|uniref:hypothetical protein n=1 Tax=Parvibaculum indicum TaxID=562969 RepID=UPI0014223D5D|nr:hypothetical protein [Parvibaculum indicum]NIJ43318.1 hypothetical protein [Parvibaculum indicum]
MRYLSDYDLDCLEEVYDDIRCLANQHLPHRKKSSFSILHAPPIHKGIPCLIIGDCPAKDEMYDHEEYYWPKKNQLVTENNIYSLVATSFFIRAGRYNSLVHAQSSDTSFFREEYGSKRVGRKTLNTLSLEYLFKLIEIFEPKSIVAVGAKAMRRLGYDDNPSANFGKPFSAYGRPAVGVVHFSTPSQFRQPGISSSIRGIQEVVPEV